MVVVSAGLRGVAVVRGRCGLGGLGDEHGGYGDEYAECGVSVLAVQLRTW